MAKRSRLILTRDGERAFGRLADGISRALDGVLRKEQVKKKDLAERAGVDQAIVSRALDGSRNLETRTVAALFGAVGYSLDVVPKPMHAAPQGRTNQPSPSDLRVDMPKPRPARIESGARDLDVTLKMRRADA